MHPQEVLLVSKPVVDNLPGIAQPLLGWYDQHKRSLPWRDNPTPYRVWISEIMLQQTRVEAVKGYYQRFLEIVPDIASLADVEESVLLKLWEGLGYYNRARNLQRAAQKVVQEFDGKLPASYGALLSLPGIGEYTAGAIASIAFGIPVPAVDGNVLRVFSRLCGSFADIALPQVKEAWRKTVPIAQPPNRPGDFNQALMELGATVCLPNTTPKCNSCPLKTLCEGAATACADQLPIKSAKKPRKVEQHTVILVVADNQVLLFQRQHKLLAGLYEPLNLLGHLAENEIIGTIQELGGKVNTVEALCNSKHLFTHVEWQMTGWLAECSYFPPPPGAAWANRIALTDTYALPSAFRAYTKDWDRWLATEEG